jgi:hypothetical protein
MSKDNKSQLMTLYLIEELKKLNLGYDHEEHQVLFNAAKSIKGVDGIVCELGLRQGGGLGLMMLTCLYNDDALRPFISIDPYGNIPYVFKEGVVIRLDYTNRMKNSTLCNLYSFCSLHNIYFDHFNLADTDFFDRYKDGIVVYHQEKNLISNYALVHLDGPHALPELLIELDFFKTRVSLKGFIVLDDVLGYYNMETIHQYLTEKSEYELVENDGRKASYKRIV